MMVGPAPVVVWGTGPNSSKTHVCLALLRLLARRGRAVVPFKAITVVEPDRWRRGPGECPIPHHVAAARTTWQPAFAPVTVELEQGGRPRGLLRIRGESRGPVEMLTSDTLDGACLKPDIRDEVITSIADALRELSGSGALVVAEGAGSPVDAEDDLANLVVARALDRPRVLLSTYCYPGGSVAAVVGTLRCLPADVRRLVVGFVQNRPPTEADAGRWAEEIERQTGVPAAGLVGDLSSVGSADLLDTSPTLADPWADALGRNVNWSLVLGEHEAGP